VENYVSETSLVRAIDAYVDTLDLEALGFANTSGDLAPGQLALGERKSPACGEP